MTSTWAPEPGEGQATPDATYSWAAPGLWVITVTAENCGGVVTGTHTIAVKKQIYLPLILKQHLPPLPTPVPPPGGWTPLTESPVGAQTWDYNEELLMSYCHPGMLSVPTGIRQLPGGGWTIVDWLAMSLCYRLVGPVEDAFVRLAEKVGPGGEAYPSRR